MKRILPIVLAVLVALVAAIAVFQYTRSAEERAVSSQQPVTVLVSKGVIPQGMALGDAFAGGLAEQTQVPGDLAPAGALGAVTPENSALLSLNNVDPGQILLASNFVIELPDVTPISVPDGMIAISFVVGDTERVGTFVRPGSEVVVFDTYPTGPAPEGGGDPTGVTTRVLLDRALVLGVGESTTQVVTNPDGTTTNPTPTGLLTVALDQQGSEKLIQAIRSGDQLYLGLLGAGTEITKTQGTSSGNLFD